MPDYILGRQKSTSGWIKKYLKQEKILDYKYKLTKKGEVIKKAIEDMKEEIS